MKKASAIEHDTRIYCQFEALAALIQQAKGFSFLAHNAKTGLLTGRHQSHFRGRGLNFEELRHYQPGDDMRSFDWKVTLRTGKPHVRVYSEEKEHRVVLCVDQRSSMFFSSVETMKSVVAAEIGAVCGWRALADNDRVGALLFSDQQQSWFQPKRQQAQMMRILQTLTQFNQNLSSTTELTTQHCEAQLNKALHRLVSSTLKDDIIIIISDFSGLNSDTIKYLKMLQAHNDVFAILIADELEKKWLMSDGLVVSNGQSQLQVNALSDEVHDAYQAQFASRKSLLSRLLLSPSTPLMELDTSGLHIKQFRQALGGNNESEYQ